MFLALCSTTFGALADTVSTNMVSGMPASALPDSGASLFRVFGAMILVIAIFFGGVWLFRNWQRLSVKKGAAPKLSVLEVKSLGQRQSIYVIGYQQQRMLLASSPAGVTLVSHLPAVEENGETVAPTMGKMSFVEAFQQVLSRKQ
jgi:flagellar biogenesis protein FliO